MKKEKEQEFTLGGILAVIGLIAFTQGQFQAALFLLGIGVVFMGRSSEEFQRKFTNFIFSIFKSLWNILSGLK